jgi:nitroimidazol reductase NimA-like FMN-containing flavoprotein (pyridoxamine 5'-phosphate oxidase superfamily)
MLINDMTREMSVDLLKRTHIGRLGCAQGLQPYVVPLSFAYHREFIYSFTTIGKKIEWMRANPLVCVEADEIVSRHEWQTVVIFGRYQELPDTPEFHRTRMVAHDLLAKTAMWWEPGYASCGRGARLPLPKTPERAILRPTTTGNPGNVG